jgi:hypothetical protein
MASCRIKFAVPCVFNEEEKNDGKISMFKWQSWLENKSCFHTVHKNCIFLSQPSITTWKEHLLKRKYDTF